MQPGFTGKNTEMRIELPENVKKVIAALHDSGYEAYAVGGCVRDSCLGREPGDWDVTTSARPEEIKQVFRHTVDTGIEHGTVTVLIYNEDDTFGAYEVTTYRIDGEYADGRHPMHVEFTPSLIEDLKRRDFTINAMAYNDDAGIVDMFDGMADLDRKVIRCVGVADERFDEDALRILRALRFSAQLGFTIAEETAHSILKKGQNLEKVSRERVYAELNKLLCSARHERIRDIQALGLSPYIAAGFEKTEPAEVPLPEIPTEKRYLRYAVIFRNAPKAVSPFLRELKADNDTIRGASVLAAALNAEIPAEPYELKCFIGRLGTQYFEDLLELKRELKHDTAAARASYAEITAANEPIFLKDLALTGSDLVKAGVTPGPKVGDLLEAILDTVRRDPAKNTAEELEKLYL